MEYEKQNYKHRYDAHRLKNVEYNESDIVFMKSNPVSTGESTKLQSKFKSPLVITKALQNDNYAVTSLRKQSAKSSSTTAHVSQLKIWNSDNQMSSDNGDFESAQESIDDDKINENDRNVNSALQFDQQFTDVKHKSSGIRKTPNYLRF